MRLLKCITLRDWRTRRQDRKTEEYWRRQELEGSLSSWKIYQREWNFIESYYGSGATNNGLDPANPGFAFDTSLAKFLVESVVEVNPEEENMNTNTVLKEDEEETNVLPFRLATGGGNFAGSPPGGDIWLNDLVEGTVFLAELKQSADPFAHCFIVLNKFDKAVVLDHQVGGQHDIRFAIPHKFSNQWRWIMTMDVMVRNEKEQKDGDRDTRPSEPMDSHEEPQGINPDDEGNKSGLV